MSTDETLTARAAAFSRRIADLSADEMDAGGDPFQTMAALAFAMGRIIGAGYAETQAPEMFTRLFNIALEAAHEQREA